MKNIGKPCTGKPYARFDEGGQGDLLSTLPFALQEESRYAKQVEYGTSPRNW